MEENPNIDIVYAWVDGNDPAWIAKHDEFLGLPVRKPDDCKGRYFNNDELRFSLRSVEAYAPWIRKIFIVTDNQIPSWLDVNHPKIEIVDHKQIIPEEYLPTFNAFIIEHFLHRIPGLSERFLYANDDMFLNKPVTHETFFAKDGFPIVRSLRQWSMEANVFFKEKILHHHVSSYQHALQNSARLVNKKYGVYYNGKPHHNIDAYLRSDYEQAFKEFQDVINPTLPNHLRTDHDISRLLYSIVPLARKRGHLEYVGRDVSFRLPIHKHRMYATLAKCKPTFFCMNDSEHVSDEDRIVARKFMEARFPKKSSFEI